MNFLGNFAIMYRDAPFKDGVIEVMGSDMQAIEFSHYSFENGRPVTRTVVKFRNGDEELARPIIYAQTPQLAMAAAMKVAIDREIAARTPQEHTA
jgi:hypothetical protein